MGSPGFVSLLKVFFKNFDVFAGPVVSLLYPLYESIRAIESKNPEDDQQWLTYWILYSMITIFEITFANFLEWIPIWSYAKLAATCWLVMPYFNGATYVYDHFVRPYVVKPEAINIWFLPHENPDVLVAAKQYIAEHGTRDFEKLIKKVTMEKKELHDKNSALEEMISMLRSEINERAAESNLDLNLALGDLALPVADLAFQKAQMTMNPVYIYPIGRNPPQLYPAPVRQIPPLYHE